MTKAKCICDDPNLTPEEKWELIYGTTAIGNLPQHKKHEHTGYCWKPCPYSTQADDVLTRALLGLAPEATLPTKVDHTNIVEGRTYFMDKDYRGGWGFFCTYDDCPYYLSTGSRFFHR